MRKLIVIILVVLLAVIAWWFLSATDQLSEEALVDEVSNTTPTQSDTISDSAADADLIVREPSSPDRKVYINQEWRFSFEYPTEWTVGEPSFRSRALMFNIEVRPPEIRFPYAILISTSPKWWIDRLLPEIEAQKNLPQKAVVGGRESAVASFKNNSVIPGQQYFTLIGNEYWVHISGTLGFDHNPGYPEELEIIRSSFQFHEPLPTLDELDVEPYIPDHVREGE